MTTFFKDKFPVFSNVQLLLFLQIFELRLGKAVFDDKNSQNNKVEADIEENDSN